VLIKILNSNTTKLPFSIIKIIAKQAYRLSKGFSILLLKVFFAYVVVNYFAKSILGNNSKY
jgi:hypothetical protein